MAFKRSWVRFPLSPPVIKNTIYSSKSCRFTCYMWCFFMWKRERAFFKAAEKIFQSLQKSVKKIHIRIFTAGIDKLWRMVYTLGANTKFYNQVKAKGARPERRLLRALRTHCNTAGGIAASSVAPIHRKMRPFRVRSNRKRVDRYTVRERYGPDQKRQAVLKLSLVRSWLVLHASLF